MSRTPDTRVIRPIDLGNRNLEAAAERAGFQVDERSDGMVVFSASTDAIQGQYPQQKVILPITPFIDAASHELNGDDPLLYLSGRGVVDLGLIGSNTVTYNSAIQNGPDGKLQVSTDISGGTGLRVLKNYVAKAAGNPDITAQIAGVFMNSLVTNGKVNGWWIGPNPEQAVKILAQPRRTGFRAA